MPQLTTRGPEVMPNVTPMIDVMLVLLIIFMVTTPALLDGASVDLPDASHVRRYREAPTDHVLTVTGGGALLLDKRPLSPPALRAALVRLTPAGNALVYLRADQGLPFREVQSALDLLRESGVRTVGMISELPPGTPRS